MCKLKPFTCQVGVLLASAGLAFGATPGFKHLLSLDLSAEFQVGSVNGEEAGDVAFDGENLYVAGYKNSSGAGTVGILKIASPFAAPAKSNLASVENQAGGGRDTKLVFFNNSLYLGTGLGETSDNLSGIRKFDLGGAVDAGFSGGVLTPSEVGNQASNRTETLTIDPGFGGSGPSLAMLNRGRGFVFRFDPATGANVGNAQITNPLNSNTWRDLAFDSSGNAVFRSANDVLTSKRLAASGGSGVAFADQARPVDLASAEAAQMNVLWVPGTADHDATILYNSRAAGAKTITVAGENGLTLLELTGDELLPGGDAVPGGAFSNGLLNFSFGSAGGKNYLFVVKGGSDDRLDVYQIVPEPASLCLLGLSAIALVRRRPRR